MKMHCKSLLIAALLASAQWFASVACAQLIYVNEVVSSRAEIAGAGNAGLPDGSGVAPLVFGLPTNATVLTIQSVTGLITLNGGTGSNDADGVLVSGTYNTGLPNGNSYSGPYGGISGITNKGAGALVGVFEPA